MGNHRTSQYRRQDSRQGHAPKAGRPVKAT